MKYAFILACVSLLAPVRALPEVADSSAAGFTVKLTVNVQSAPNIVYRKLVHDVGDWWDPAHTFSGNSHSLTIDEKPGGCFCEKIQDGGAVRHMELIYFAPAKQLVLTGALGPLQSLAATGSMTIKFTPSDGGTKLDVVYTVVGYLPAGMNTWAAPVDGVLKLQFTRLKNYIEQGDPAQSK